MEQQVVVLKVSLHCRGCEGKVRKHLAKMQGDSFIYGNAILFLFLVRHVA